VVKRIAAAPPPSGEPASLEKAQGRRSSSINDPAQIRRNPITPENSYRPGGKPNLQQDT
jgi:hypothetical protein